jgi:hypothetical protein
MSIRVQSEIWKHSKLKGTALLLLLAIADFADDNGWAFPSVRALAKKIRLKDRQTQSLIAQIVEAGELEIHPGEGSHRTNLYRVKVSAGRVQSAAGCSQLHLDGAILRDKRVQPAAPKTSIDVLNHQEPSSPLRAAEKRGRQADPAFQRFDEEFKRRHEVPYMPKKGDFVQLAHLRKLLGCDIRGSPADWDQAVTNYFDSQKGFYTLADLCTGCATYRQRAVDRFKQPIGAMNANNTISNPTPDTRQDANIADAHRLRLRARIAAANRGGD